VALRVGQIAKLIAHPSLLREIGRIRLGERETAERLDRLERRLDRLETALAPPEPATNARVIPFPTRGGHEPRGRHERGLTGDQRG
jgi:hypothetical protein